MVPTGSLATLYHFESYTNVLPFIITTLLVYMYMILNGKGSSVVVHLGTVLFPFFSLTSIVVCLIFVCFSSWLFCCVLYYS